MSETIVVAGATGYLGRHVVTALDARGYGVRALVRSRERAEAPGAFGAPSLAGHVAQWRVVDYRDPTTLRDACEGATRVVSALGVTRQKASPWDIDFLGNLRLLEDAERHGVVSFLYVNVLHSDSGTSLTMRAKHAFSEVLRRSGVAGQIVNPSGYFSDITDFLLMARKGVGFTVGSGEARVNPIHGADLAEFIVERLAGPAGSWDVGGPDVFTYRELEELAFRVAGRRPRVLRLGSGATRPLLWAADRSSPRIGNLARFFLESLAVDALGTPTGARRLEPYLRSLP
ncbi:MAG: NAD(P)H-binding protein [Trueperaceae bacterium]|nr:NAD(P)H-binding protein [Trueperaceae bacterium]MCC6312158.1 NAD(P)H-binding protein [Trueperaceae bacterium]MCO5172813.1 NAD(P)H-binding protein [Trueperaceae bacterium]MCW5820381.1 NAD(P)H-binding protein [Trueperaceae bacterium]